MKTKKEGFATIECIFSITILCLGIYVISNTLYNSYSFTLYNKDRFEMLNIAKSKMEEAKYEIKNNIIEKVNNASKYDELKDYKIDTIIEKSKEYYQCYKVSINVYSERTNISLKSYVFKQ